MTVSSLWLHNWWLNMRKMVAGRPTWSAEREYAYYNVSARTVNEHRARQKMFERDAYSLGMRVARAIGLLDTNLLRGARVLEIGAGECVLSASISVHGQAAEVWALDAVPKQLWAPAEHHAQARNIRFVIGTATDLPFEDGSFDIVACNLMLHHVEPLHGALREAFRVLAPGGRFAAFEPNPLVGTLAHEQLSDNEAAIWPWKIEAALSEAGFVGIDRTYWWTRLETAQLGALSPSYRLSALKPGAHEPARVRLRRELSPMRLKGLELDAGCPFADLVRSQEREILDVLERRPAGEAAPS
jgi:2-polyprenyl-3-methyl-5-hydroxy-6-metoxy-1,4-benzoquinol methylase